MDKAIEILQDLTGCEYVKILPSGNAAIFCAFHVVRKRFEQDLAKCKRHGVQFDSKLGVPDQGGWLKYKPYARELGIPFIIDKTNRGMYENLAHINARIVADPAGYFVKQKWPKEIKTNSDFLILDISGSIGKEYVKEYKADCLIGSFGRWKPIDIGYGGFFATNDEVVWKYAKELFGLFKIYDPKSLFEKELVSKLKKLDKRYRMFDKVRYKIKKDLSRFEILFPEADGINIIIKYRTPNQKEEITDYCDKKGYEYTECPREIRINEEAISIEVKRL